MNQFIQNYPVLSVVGFILIILCIAVLAYTLRLIYKERLRVKVKKQSKRIVNLMADVSELESRNEYLSVKRINQGIEIEMLKDQLKSAQLGAKVMPFVEGMTAEFTRTLNDNERLKSLFKSKDEQLAEMKTAFTQASNELNNLQKAEKENVDLKAMYRKCVEENEQLKERAKRLQETIEHKRHSKSEPKETGYWTPKKDIDGIFLTGIAYRVDDSKGKSLYHINLWSGNKSYLVNKSDMNPCNSNGIVLEKPVKEHEKGIASDQN